jgi:hypothetical protein
MVSFQVLIAIVKWVMLHLGRPLNSAAALTPTLGYGVVPPGSLSVSGVVRQRTPVGRGWFFAGGWAWQTEPGSRWSVVGW